MNDTLTGGISTEDSQNSSEEQTSPSVKNAIPKVNGLQVLSVLLVVASSVVAVLLSLKDSKNPSVSIALNTSEIPGWLVLSLRKGNTNVMHAEDLPGKVIKDE